jgi:predicted ester cyclase
MKNLLIVFPLFILLCVSFGCQDKEAMSELEKFKIQAEVEEQNKVLIRKFFKEWNNRNIDILNELYVPNARYHHPSIGSTPISFENAMEMIKIFWQAFPDLTITIEDIFAKGNKVVVRFIGRGTHQGDLGGIPTTGIFHIVDGKIVEAWEISDRLGLMQQLGMELKPKEGKK